LNIGSYVGLVKSIVGAIDHQYVIGAFEYCRNRHNLPSSGADAVDVKSACATVFAISDLHIGAGLSADGVYDGLENFLGDEVFGRFLEWAHRRAAGRSAILVIDADFVNFIRIVTRPPPTPTLLHGATRLVN
jgi:hypothetical protein